MVVPVGKVTIAVGTLTSGLPVGVMATVVVGGGGGAVEVDCGGIVSMDGDDGVVGDDCEGVDVVVVSDGRTCVGTVG